MNYLIPAALECHLRRKEENKSESITLDFKDIWKSSESAASFQTASDMVPMGDNGEVKTGVILGVEGNTHKYIHLLHKDSPGLIL